MRTDRNNRPAISLLENPCDASVATSRSRDDSAVDASPGCERIGVVAPSHDSSNWLTRCDRRPAPRSSPIADRRREAAMAASAAGQVAAHRRERPPLPRRGRRRCRTRHQQHVGHELQPRGCPRQQQLRPVDRPRRCRRDGGASWSTKLSLPTRPLSLASSAAVRSAAMAEARSSASSSAQAMPIAVSSWAKPWSIGRRWSCTSPLRVAGEVAELAGRRREDRPRQPHAGGEAGMHRCGECLLGPSPARDRGGPRPGATAPRSRLPRPDPDGCRPPRARRTRPTPSRRRPAPNPPR